VDPDAGTLCDNLPTDLQSDPTHCGSCVTRCIPTEVCTEGTCACPSGRTLCFNRCEDFANDRRHCGGCGAACRVGEECCDGACADFATSHEHCGSCGHACGPTEGCVSGVCAPCPSGLTLCGGQCVALETDQKNCGYCGNDCTPDIDLPASCLGGRCLRKVGTFPQAQPITQLELDGSWLYFSTGSSISRLPVTGGAVSPVSDVAGPFVMDATNVYGIDWQRRVVGQPKGGGQPFVLGPLPGQDFLGAIGGPFVFAGQYRVPIAGGPVEKISFPLLTLLSPSVAADGTYAYYLDGDGVLRVPHSGTAPERIVYGFTDSQQGRALRSVKGGVLFIDANSDLVRATFTATYTTLASSVGGFVVRGDTVYFSAPESPTVPTHRLFRMPAKGGVPEIVHPLAPSGAAVAVGPDTLYMLTGGVLWRVYPL
jgi:hypothetical protein